MRFKKKYFIQNEGLTERIVYEILQDMTACPVLGLAYESIADIPREEMTEAWIDIVNKELDEFFEKRG